MSGVAGLSAWIYATTIDSNTATADAGLRCAHAALLPLCESPLS